jgi:hypothetical protein
MSMRDERDAADPVLATCARLLESAEPLDPTGVMQARVRRKLASGDVRAQRSTRLLRPALVMLVVLSLLSIATAMFLRRSHEKPAPQPSTVHGLRRSLPATESAVPAPVAPLVSAAPPSTRAVTPHHHVAIPDTAVDAERRASIAELAEPRPASTEEAQLVMAELEALRIAHDADRALALFDAYSTRYPDGVLFEEALAYAIEAAVARNGTDAGVLAQKYLTRFPHGRFRVIAQHAKERFGR